MSRSLKASTGNPRDRWRFSLVAMLVGMSSLTGCGGDSSPATESEGEVVELTETDPSQPNLDLETESGQSQALLLQTAPDQWLRTQVGKAQKLRREHHYTEELEIWNGIVAGLENRAGAGYWITAGARLSREVAGTLASLDSQQRESWQRFESLEIEVVRQRRDGTEKLLSKELDNEAYQKRLSQLLIKLDEQEQIVESLFGRRSHLLGNLAYTRSEILADKGDFLSALVQAEKSLKIRELTIKVQHPDTLRTLKLMGRLAKEAGRLDLAHNCFSRALRQAEHVWGRDHLSYADHANDLGVFYYWTIVNRQPTGYSYSDAAYWLETALRIREDQLGTDHLLTAMSHRNYALLKMAEGTSKTREIGQLDLEVAASSFDESIPVFRSRSKDLALVTQVILESATAKMLVREFATAEERLKEVRNGRLAQFQSSSLSISLAELDYRIAASCLAQESADKKQEGKEIMEMLVSNTSKDPTELRMADKARKKLASLEPAGRILPEISDLPASEVSIQTAKPDSDLKIR